VKLVIVRDLNAGQDHAVVAARLDGNWIILDNRWLIMVDDNKMSGMLPLFCARSNRRQAFALTTRPDVRPARAPPEAAASAPASL